MEKMRLADGTDLHLARIGDPDAAVTVIFVHGYALDYRSWNRLAKPLLETAEEPIQVVRFDQRGHGRSSRATPATATLEQLGDDLAALVRYVAQGKVVLVGHSMGAMTMLALVDRHPDLLADRTVAGLVLLAAGGNTVAPEARAATGMAIEPSASRIPAVITKVMWDLEAVLGSSVVDALTGRAHKAMVTAMRWSLFGDNPRSDDVLLTWRMIHKHWPKTMALFRTALDAYVAGAKLLVPDGLDVVGIAGERDRLVPVEHMRLLLDSVPGAVTVVLPAAGHMIPLERPAEVLPRIVGVVHAVQRSLRDGAL